MASPLPTLVSGIHSLVPLCIVSIEAIDEEVGLALGAKLLRRAAALARYILLPLH